MTIRPLTEIAEFKQCIELQREIWGMADVELLPSRIYVVQTLIGGLVLGAFEEEQLIAFLNAMPGIREGMPYWHSLTLAVRKDHWNSGIGARLKLAQREHARERGIRLIQWTYDPLESKNAYLNVGKLGAIVRKYYVNAFGTPESALAKGLDSDRVIAEWWVDEPRVEVVGDDVRRVFIPAEIQQLKKQSLKSAQDVQLRVREQFLKNLEDDYFVAGFERTDEWNAYLFIPGASSVHQAD
jgi:predicted GNAT superfamily acetyltransferase